MTWIDDLIDIALVVIIGVIIFYGGRFYADQQFLSQCQTGNVVVMGHKFDVYGSEK